MLQFWLFKEAKVNEPLVAFWVYTVSCPIWTMHPVWQSYSSKPKLTPTIICQTWIYINIIRNYFQNLHVHLSLNNIYMLYLDIYIWVWIIYTRIICRYLNKNCINIQFGKFVMPIDQQLQLLFNVHSEYLKLQGN